MRDRVQPLPRSAPEAADSSLPAARVTSSHLALPSGRDRQRSSLRVAAHQTASQTAPLEIRVPAIPQPSYAQSVTSGESQFDVSELQSLTLPTALEMLLVAIDQCRYLLSAPRAAAGWGGSSAAAKLSNELPARQQRELDRAIEAFWADVEGRIGKEIAKLSSADEDQDDDIYPMATELLATMIDVQYEEIKTQAMHVHFRQYAKDRPKADYILTTVRLGPASRVDSVLGMALLPMIVAKIEQFIGALARAHLRMHPDALGKLDRASIPYPVYKRFGANLSTADIDRWLADRKIKDLIDQSPDKWREAIQKLTGIDVANIGADWEALGELVLRRHVVVHNDSRVDLGYLSQAGSQLKPDIQLGGFLECGSAYLTPVLDELEAWAMSLTSRWAKKLFKETAKYYRLLIDRVIRFENLGKWNQAIAILNSFLAEPVASEYDTVVIARINQWFCMQELDFEAERAEKEVADWTTSSAAIDPETEFVARISRCALLRDYDGLVTAFEERASDEANRRLLRRDYQDMPLIRRAISESPAVRSLLLGGGGSPRAPQAGPSSPKGTRRRKPKR